MGRGGEVMRVATRTVARERRADILAAAIGVALLAVASAAAAAPLTDAEAQVFRAVNDLPDTIRPYVWPLMQYGTFITIPLLVAVALVLRRYRFATALAVSGVGVYFLAKAVKLLVERGRPGELLADVHAREVFQEGSLGFPSGHAAVATALVVTCAGCIGMRWLGASVFLAVVVPIGRLYVGAHLPLDLIGGAALGLIAASATRLVFGRPCARTPAGDDTRLMPDVQPEPRPGDPGGT
jgi:membrane-associated phospholipid phosphatase